MLWHLFHILQRPSFPLFKTTTNPLKVISSMVQYYITKLFIYSSSAIGLWTLALSYLHPIFITIHPETTIFLCTIPVFKTSVLLNPTIRLNKILQWNTIAPFMSVCSRLTDTCWQYLWWLSYPFLACCKNWSLTNKEDFASIRFSSNIALPFFLYSFLGKCPDLSSPNTLQH